MRSVDVDDVQRDCDAGDAPGLGHELIGDQMRRDLIEDPGDLECQRPAAAQLSRSDERGRRHLTGPAHLRDRRRFARVAIKSTLERVAVGEVAIERRTADVRRRRDLGHGDPTISPRRGCRGENPLTAGQSVRPRKGRPAQTLRSRGLRHAATDGSGPCAARCRLVRPSPPASLARTSRRVPALSLSLSQIRLECGFGQRRAGSGRVHASRLAGTTLDSRAMYADAWTATGKRSTDQTRQWR